MSYILSYRIDIIKLEILVIIIQYTMYVIICRQMLMLASELSVLVYYQSVYYSVHHTLSWRIIWFKMKIQLEFAAHWIVNSTRNYNFELRWNFNSIQNYSFELNCQSNAANSSWIFILNQMIRRESVSQVCYPLIMLIAAKLRGSALHLSNLF